ncbi:MAG: lysylphosphatidylglycerol synthase transmembrane domain-containing protein [Pyrinomonadaceae bacterium]
MSTEQDAEKPGLETPRLTAKQTTRLKVLATILTVGGLVLFGYFIHSVGLDDLLTFVSRFGFFGFGVILGLYFLRMTARALAWKLSVYEPYRLSLRDAVQAVIIGESLSSLIPLGILISGTSKAVAVRRKLPLVVGLSSVATENLFYSIVTSLFLIIGSYTFVRSFDLEEGWVVTIDALIVVIFAVMAFIVVMIVRQWHFASELCEKIYQRGYLTRHLEHGRMHVRLFENFIYGFYRQYPRRFLPICMLEAAYHLAGVAEVYFILGRLLETAPTLVSAFLLESVSRLITIVFKLVPFLVGVDEAGARFVADTLAIGAGVGVSLAIIRKGRILFWTAVGLLLILSRGLSLRQMLEQRFEHSRAPHS